MPGRVIVVGHTDDQPIKSLRYRDNYELSRERAVSVANVLQRALDNPARLTLARRRFVAAAIVQESDPENRARNRRVEIIHLREAADGGRG